MQESIKYKQHYYILADSSLAEKENRVLKYGDTFAVFDSNGDICRFNFEDEGIYHEGTRYVSRLTLKLNDKHPLLLNSAVREKNDQLITDFTNPDFRPDSGVLIKRGTIHLLRSVFLYKNNCYTQLCVTNFGLETVNFRLSFEFDSDYIDIFEVRGIERKRRGRINNPQINKSTVVLSYTGLDDIQRMTEFHFDPEPVSLTEKDAVFDITIEPKQKQEIFLTVSCQDTQQKTQSPYWPEAKKNLEREFAQLLKGRCVLNTSNEEFNDWLNRSSADLFMLLTKTKHGLYPYAGIPWFSTVFGRDGLITALETLWIYPDIARGVLSYLAEQQAKILNSHQESEPGKILHEQRKGEMVNLGELPFGQYYGSIDSTPLFLVLAGKYFERTADKEFLWRIWPSLESALKWIDEYGDLDGDGFVEYQQQVSGGLIHQGWKDSDDSIFHSSGDLALTPITLCEVQGYVYEAKLLMSKISNILGKNDLSQLLAVQADQLKERFDTQFWVEEIGTYALALDKDKKPCEVRSSNAGHCLFSGIATERAAENLAKLFTSEIFYSGWGIRTIAEGQARYNPMSYHNGSIWPHDNAIISLGLSRYGHKDEAMKVLQGIFDTSLFVDFRLPELFCGFPRRKGEGPTMYPVACKPQAWAAGTVFMLLQACLGINIDCQNKTICFDNPVLPPFIQEFKIKHLCIADSSVDIDIQRYPNDVALNVKRRKGDIEVLIKK